MRWFSILIVCLLSFASTASAQEPLVKGDVTTFGAKKAEKAPPAPDDFRAMLAVCDEQRESCEKDAVGVPFLAAAYMALWLILLGFLFSIRAGNARTRTEMEELRSRLRELEEGTG